MKAENIARRVEALEVSGTADVPMCEFRLRDGRFVSMSRDRAYKGLSDAVSGTMTDDGRVVLTAGYSKGLGRLCELAHMIL